LCGTGRLQRGAQGEQVSHAASMSAIRPRCAVSFSSNAGSVETLYVSTRCGLSPRACQRRATVDRLTPAVAGHRLGAPMRFAFRLGVQCVVHDLLHLLRGDRRLRPPRRADLPELGQALLGEPGPPLASSVVSCDALSRRRGPSLPDSACGCEVTVTKGAPPACAVQQNPTCCCGKTILLAHFSCCGRVLRPAGTTPVKCRRADTPQGGCHAGARPATPRRGGARRPGASDLSA
jgi:hypothetical protein